MLERLNPLSINPLSIFSIPFLRRSSTLSQSDSDDSEELPYSGGSPNSKSPRINSSSVLGVLSVLGGVIGGALTTVVLSLIPLLNSQSSHENKIIIPFDSRPLPPPAVKPPSKLDVQGIEKNALTVENLKTIEEGLTYSLNNNGLSNLPSHKAILARYLKPRVVFITKDYSAGGAGFIYSSDNSGTTIITCNHVTGSKSPLTPPTNKENTSKVKVLLLDGREVDGKVIRQDIGNDLALIKINLKNLPTIKLREDEVKVGEDVMAVGHPPPGLGWSVTSGIVSGKGRINRESNIELIQTDTPINFGNSGGPLTDMRGELIGINQIVLRGTFGDLEGLGFSIPAKKIRDLLL